MATQTTVTIDDVMALEGEIIRVYLWFKMTCPPYGMEFKFQEIADDLQMSTKTVQRAIKKLVADRYLDREWHPGYIPTYKVLK